MKKHMIKGIDIIKSGLIGVVIAIIFWLFMRGISLQNSDPLASGFALSSGVVAVIFGLEMYYGKKTDKKLDEIIKRLDNLEKK